MTAGAFARFQECVDRLKPASAIVLGSGLAGAVEQLHLTASVPFDCVPGLVPTAISGHAGLIAIGDWAGRPALVCFGRLHYYEGHRLDVVTAPVRILAALGARRLLLTNSAGGIHPDLEPGSLMLVRCHLKLLTSRDWCEIARGREPFSAYSDRIGTLLQQHEDSAGHEIKSGTYATVTGPSYETPAEIRALRALGADVVGMSTADEAEAALALGMEVAAISCITNRAAGLGEKPLDHAEVLLNAQLGIARLGELIEQFVSYE